MDSGKSKLILRKVQSLLPCHMLYVEVNEKSALLREPLRKQGSWSGQQLIGSLKLGNIWFFVQRILGPPWPMNELNKNPNIA